MSPPASQVVLTLVGGVVQGRTATTNRLVFTVSVDGSGNVTLDQQRAVQHNDPSDPIETGASAATLSADNLVTLGIVATDRDGDQASLTVNIGQNLHFEDDGPHLGLATGSEPTITVDETDLTVDGTGNFATVLGLAGSGYGNDGAGTTVFTLSVSSAGAASGLFDVATGNQIYLYQVGDTIVGKVGSGPATANPAGATSFVVSVDSSGVVTLNQQLAIQHSPDTGPDQPVSMATDSLINLKLVVTDGDGDSVSSSVNIASNLVFEDDAPHVGASSGTEPTITVDETDVTVNATGNFAALLGLSGSGYGADGAGTTVFTLTVSSAGAASGLFDVATGNQIYLYQVGDTIVGKVGSGPATANPAGATSFVVSVDSSGVVTLDQQLPMTHPDASNPDDPVSMATDSLINLSLVVTDKDGDVASSSVNIASNLVFEDDGPSVTITAAPEPVLTVDETTLPANIGPVSFIDDFDIDFGADGPAVANATAFSLSITAGPSGLIDTATGNQVFLFLEGGVVVGREGTSIVDAATGDSVFTVSVNAAGAVTLNQQRAVVHGDPTDPDEADTPAQLSADDLIKLNVVATDKDGDTASASINIARNLAFEDDGPTAQNEAQQNVNEGATISGAFDFAPGSDGATVTHINGTTLVFDGVTHWSQWIAVDDGQIRAQANGSYEFQANGSASGVTNGTYTVTDGDGDPSTANWAFNILDVGTPTAGASDARLDDDGLAGGNPASTTGDIDANVGEVAAVNPSEAVFHGDLNADFGSDGAGTISFAEMVGQFRMVGTERVHFTWDPGTLTLTAVIDATSDGVTPQARAGTSLFSLVLDPSLNGNYTLTLLDNVLHASGGNETSAPNVALAFHIVDSDNSPAGGAAGTLNIEFNDDAPSLGISSGSEPTITVDETNLAIDSTGNFAAFLGGPGAYGADGAGTTAYTLTVSGAGAASGLFDVATGNQIYLYQVGNTIVGRVGSGVATPNPAGATSFVVSVDASGVVSLDQQLALTHPNASNPDDSVSMATDSLISLKLVITDADGDTASSSVNIASNLTFKDDGPHLGTPSGTEPTITVDETNLAVDSTGNFAALLGLAGSGYGADGAGTTVFTLTVSSAGAASGLFDVATGNQIYLYQSGNTIVGRVGSGVATPNPAGATSFVVSVDASGVVTLDQQLALTHPNASNPDDSVSMATDSLINLKLVVTDRDGDSVSSSVNIASNLTFKDDGPHLGTPSGTEPTITVDETNLAVDSTGNFGALLGLAGSGYGADGAGTTAFTLTVSSPGAASGLFDVATGNQIYLYQSGNTIVGRVGSGPATPNPAGATSFVVSVDASGVVTLDQQLALTHPDASNPDDSVSMATDSLINLKLVITDRDGDSVSSSVNIASNLTFKDDGPHVGTSSGTEPTITVDETNLAVDSTGNFAALLGLAGSGYGADGAGTTAFTLTVSSAGAASGLFDVATGNQIYLYQSGNTIVGRVGSGVATPNPAGATSFVVSVDASGVVTLDQQLAIQHSPDSGPDQSVSMATDSLINLKLVVTDRDGDVASSSVNIASNLVFKDDAPHVGASSGTEPTITVDETSLATDSTGNFAALLGLAGSGYGADGAGTTAFTLTVSGAGAASGLFDVATGNQIYLYQSGNTIVGRVGSGVATPNPAGATSFVVSVDASGVVTLDQQLAIQHTPDSGPDQSVSMATDSLINLKLVVTDRDGDIASSSVNIASNLVFKDDAPSTFDPAATVLTDQAGATATVGLDVDSNILNNMGADGPGSIQFANIVNGQDTLLKSGGVMIELWLSGGGQTLQGRTGSTNGVDGTLIYTVQLNQAAGTYTTTIAVPIDNGSGVSFANLSGGVAGNPPFKLIESSSADSLEMLVTPINAGSVNSDSDDIAVDSQFIDIANPDKGIRFDFGDFTYDANGGGTSDDAFVIVNHQTVNGFKFTIDQISGGTTADLDLKAFNADEDGNLEEQQVNTAGDIQLAITEVKIFNDSGVLIGTFTGDGTVGGITVDFDGNTVHVLNILQQYSIQTKTAAGYDRIEVTNAGTSGGTDGKFSLSHLTLETTATGDAVSQNFDLKITDKDGDTLTVTDAIQITVNPVAPPVVLDLDGDGVEFLGHSAGVHYDYGAGLVSTAWAGADDGILVRDANHNGTVDNASEFVFGGNGDRHAGAARPVWRPARRQ
jgi:hypothetical protein